MNAIDKLNDFVDQKVTPLKVDLDRVVEATSKLDWIRQVYGGNHYLDCKNNCLNVGEGLMYAAELIGKLTKSVEDIKEVLCTELYEAYKIIESTPSKEELDKLNRVRQLLS